MLERPRSRSGAGRRGKGPILLQVANLLKYRGFSLGASIVPRLPPAVTYGVALKLADLARQLTPGRRAIVATNLRHVLGADAASAQIGRHTREIYQNIARYYVDVLLLPTLDPVRLERERVRDFGFHHLEAAIAEGRGVIIVTPHFGNPDLTIQAARVRGLEFFTITEPIDPPELADLYLRLRSSHGHRFMSVGMAAGKEAIRTLRRGGIIVLVSDRDIQGAGIPVKFFGEEAPMPTGAVDLARLTGAAIIPAFSRRMPNDSIELIVEPRVDLIRTTNRHADQRTNVERVVQRFERHIRRAPGQWLVLEPIWPVRGNGQQATGNGQR